MMFSIVRHPAQFVSKAPGEHRRFKNMEPSTSKGPIENKNGTRFGKFMYNYFPNSVFSCTHGIIGESLLITALINYV